MERKKQNFGFVWDSCEYVRKSQPSPLRSALLLIEKKKGVGFCGCHVSLVTPPSKGTIHLWKDLTLPHLAETSLGINHSSCSLQTFLHFTSPSVPLLSLSLALTGNQHHRVSLHKGRMCSSHLTQCYWHSGHRTGELSPGHCPVTAQPGSGSCSWGLADTTETFIQVFVMALFWPCHQTIEPQGF